MGFRKKHCSPTAAGLARRTMSGISNRDDEWQRPKWGRCRPGLSGAGSGRNKIGNLRKPPQSRLTTPTYQAHCGRSFWSQDAISSAKRGFVASSVNARTASNERNCLSPWRSRTLLSLFLGSFINRSNSLVTSSVEAAAKAAANPIFTRPVGAASYSDLSVDQPIEASGTARARAIPSRMTSEYGLSR